MELDFFKKTNFSTDSLTGVYNRESIVDYINHLVVNEVPFALGIIDIDNFKYVNDTYGHISGDKIIIAVAKEIEKKLGSYGVIGRFGGDEFILVMEGITDYNDLWSICHNRIGKVNGLSLPDFPGLYITITQGYSRFPLDAHNYTDLLETCDKALYRGKIKGRNCFIIYLEEKHKNIVLKAERDKSLSSMQLHTNIFKCLSNPNGLKDGIADLFAFLSSSLMLDHICLQDSDSIIFEKIHNLSTTQKYEYIPSKLLEDIMNSSTNTMYINSTVTLVETHDFQLLDSFKKQHISAICCSGIIYQDKNYGLLRADMTSSRRIWQHNDMDLLITASKTIGMMLHYEGKTLKDLL